MKKKNASAAPAPAPTAPATQPAVKPEASGPKVILSETNPGEEPLARVAAELSNRADVMVSLKNSREKVIAAIQNRRDLPLLDQEYLLARIAAIPAPFDLIAVDYHGHAFKDGYNWTGTVRPL